MLVFLISEYIMGLRASTCNTDPERLEKEGEYMMLDKVLKVATKSMFMSDEVWFRHARCSNYSSWKSMVCGSYGMAV